MVNTPRWQNDGVNPVGPAQSLLPSFAEKSSPHIIGLPILLASKAVSLLYAESDLNRVARMKERLSTALFPFCLLFLFGGQAVYAQYRFDHWTADNGLPQNSVRDIVQTRDGYLWLTTFDGLVRFDGVRFTVFNKSNSPGINTNRFLYLYEDGNGDLWVTTEDNSLTRLHNGGFTTYTTENGLPFAFMNGIGGDGHGNLVLFSGLRLFRWTDGKFQPADDLRLPQGEVQTDKTQHLAHSRDQQKVVCFVDGQLRMWDMASLPFANPDPRIEDGQGNTWFRSDEGLIKIRNGQVVKTYTPRDGLPGKEAALAFGQMPPKALSISESGALWLTDLNSMQSELMAQHSPEGLGIQLTYADREGDIWFGTLYDGLYRARKQSITSYAKPQGLTDTEVYPIFEDRAGTIWVGSTAMFRFKDGAFTRCASDFVGHVNSIYQDRAGLLWINGRWHLEHRGLVRDISKDVLPEGEGFVWTMYEDRDGAFWLGTETGVVRYQNGSTTHYTTKDGLAGDDTKVIIEDGTGGLWLGSYGGLTHFKDGHFTAWTERDGLPAHTVRALYQDSDGALWIGTYDGGLGRFMDGRFTRYTMKDGLYGEGVFQILEDSAGWFWMSCNRGIYRVRKQELNDFADGKIKSIYSIGYGKSDGMLNAECNGGRWPAGVRARDGKLWFPTMGGVVVIDPTTVSTHTQPPPVVIESLLVDRIPTAFDSAVRITPQQENFEIQYTALSFINSENLRFKYKLEGLDHDWVEAGTRRTAYFSHVPPGEYTFRVIAANSDGVWNEEGKTLRLRVLPPFYQTWWFFSMVAAALIIVVWLAFRYRVAQFRQRNEQQERFARELLASQEDERKRIAVELHDSLGQNLLVIKNRALLNAMTTTDEQGRERFNEFSDAVSQTLEEVRTISHDLRPPHLDQLGLRTALVAMIEKVGTSSTIRFAHQIGELDGLFSPGDEILLYRIVQESLNNIIKHSGATEAEIKATLTDGQLTLSIRDNGRGFTPDGNERGRAGLGLQGITERVRILGATQSIHSAPGRGTTLTLTASLKEPQALQQ